MSWLRFSGFGLIAVALAARSLSVLRDAALQAVVAGAVQRHFEVVVGDVPALRARATDGNPHASFEVAAANLHAELTALLGEHAGVLSPSINGVSVYWATGFAAIDESHSILLVTADDGDAHAINNGENGAAYAVSLPKTEINPEQTGDAPRDSTPDFPE